eukprot:TRINITY_DN3161_c1_g1_i1.p1 TRINITY_DN3161_c1_g1~~TRINITY_DN3161_c1_g1_i1.p1  ORF type:complete len:172 (-),score=38.58 TRINITY_DN3161_c1_g1_i1:111-626(-)
MTQVVDSTYGAQQLGTKLKEYKRKYARLEAEVNESFAESDQRKRILVGNQVLDNTSKHLSQTVQLAAETEEIGMVTIGRLKSDREKMEAANEELDEMDDNITKARKIITTMGRRVITNNLILGFIILLLVGAIGAVVYFKWVGPIIALASSAGTPTPTVPQPEPQPAPQPQ